VTGLLGGEQADWLDGVDGASDMPRDPCWRPAAGSVRGGPDRKRRG